MAFSTDQGDKVLLADNERLDKPDYDAAVELLNGTLGRALGFLLGPTSAGAANRGGCASIFGTSWDAPSSFLTIDAGLLIQTGALTSPSGATGARIINYDPATAWQIAAGTGVDLTGEAAGSTTCIVWAKRSTTAGSLDTRKRWVPGALAESSFGPNTRTREIVEFEVNNATFNGTGQVTGYSAPSSVVDYFPVLKITAWPAGVPTVNQISVWDGSSTLTSVGDINTRMDSLSNGGGLGGLMYYVRSRLAEIIDVTNGSNWYSGTITRGLLQLDADLSDVEARTDTCVIASGYVRNDGGWGIGAESYNLTFTSRVDGLFTLAITAFPASVARITAVHVNFRNQTSPTVNNTLMITVNPPTTIAVEAFTVGIWTVAAGVSTAPDDDGFTVTVMGGI